MKTIVVGCGQDQIRAWATSRKAASREVLAIDTARGGWSSYGLHPLASEVVLLEGWERGAHAFTAEVQLKRSLVKRNQRFKDCRRETTTSPAPFTSSIKGCARCGCDGHDDVTWEPLAYPFANVTGDFTHWAPCPNNGQPIMMRVAVTE